MGYLAFIIVYLLGGLTALPLLLLAVAAVALWTSVPVGDVDPTKEKKRKLQEESIKEEEKEKDEKADLKQAPLQQSKPRKGWLTVRRTFDDGEGALFEGSYMDLMRSILDSRSKDPKKSRPKDAYYAVLKGSVLFLYEDEAMTEAYAALEMSSHKAEIWPQGLLDGELFTKRNAVKVSTKRDRSPSPGLLHVTKEMKLDESKAIEAVAAKSKDPEAAAQKAKDIADQAREEAFDFSTPWYIFVRSVAEMEDWYHALVHASANPNTHSTLEPLQPVFSTDHMQYLVSHLDTQPDPIPMRWFNALIGRLFFSVYRTASMENYIIGRLMKKLAKVKKPSFLADIVVTEVSVGETPPTFYKPMLKELTKEGDAAVEVGVHYQGEIRITVETTATINLGARFRTYEVKLVLAVVLRELEGNLLIKIKPPPSNRVWYAFTKMPKMSLSVEPIVSDRQITWGMILKTIEGRLKEIILESVVLPNYDDIAFFETASLENRGGIYSDAVRSSLRKEEPVDLAPPVKETKSESGVELPPFEREDSMEDFKMPGHLSASAKTKVPIAAASEPVLPSVVESTMVDEVEVPPKGTETPLILGDVLTKPPSPIPPSPSPRGRTKEIAAEKQPRGTSVPVDRDSTDGEPDGGLNIPSRKSSNRTSPSRSISHSASQSIEVGSLSSQQAAPISAASAFSIPSSTLSADSKASTSSFLANLKNRTAAAVASAEASNPKAVAQARETIQKWGVQWAQLKNRAGSASPSPATSTFSINNQPSISITPDVPTPPPAAVTSNMSRGFDEMRRLVSERKQREERERVISDVGRATPLEVPLDKSKRRESAGPVLLSATEAESPTPIAREVPESPPRSRLTRSDSIGNIKVDEHEDGTTKFSPAAKSTPTVGETFLEASPSTQPRRISDASATSRAAPITAQPSYSPMSMTIPGIHAKNRNDVMSIGFSPPVPPPSAPAREENGVGSRIGNIYKLLNRNSQPPTGSNDAIGALNTVLRQEEAKQEAAERTGGSRPSTPTPVPDAAPTEISTPPRRSTSPASDALKSLVAKDTIARRNSFSRRRGSLSEYPTRSRSGSTSSPLSAAFSIPVTAPPEEIEPSS